MTSQRIVSPELASSANMIAILRTFSFESEETETLLEHPSAGFASKGTSLIMLSPLNIDLENHTDINRYTTLIDYTTLAL